MESAIAQPGMAPHPERTGDEAVTVRHEGFTKVPNLLLDDTRLSIPARLAYAVIASYAYGDKRYCFPGQKRIAKHLGVSERSVRTYLDQLVEVGYLEKKRQGQERGPAPTNLYYINEEPSTNGSDRKQASDQDAKLAGSEVSNRKHTSRVNRKQASGLEWKHTSDEEDKQNKTRLIKQVPIMPEGKIQDFPVAGSSDTASPSEALSDGGLTAAGTEGSNGEDGLDYEDIESVMEEVIDEWSDIEDIVSDETMWTDSSEENETVWVPIGELDEEYEELGVDDAFHPGDGLLSIEHFLSQPDGMPAQLASAVARGSELITTEHVAEAIKEHDPDTISREMEMSLAKRLIEAVSHQLEGATK